MNTLICLLGLHGTGKTTIAQILVERIGCTHISVGNLSRLARRGRAPRDISPDVMILLSRTKPGAILDQATVLHLNRYLHKLRQISPVVIDGFPSSPAHVDGLDHGCVLAEICVEEETRQQRLMIRSEETSRQWSPGLPSTRDSLVTQTIEAATGLGIAFKRFANNGANPRLVAIEISEWLQVVQLSNAGVSALESPPCGELSIE